MKIKFISKNTHKVIFSLLPMSTIISCSLQNDGSKNMTSGHPSDTDDPEDANSSKEEVDFLKFLQSVFRKEKNKESIPKLKDDYSINNRENSASLIGQDTVEAIGKLLQEMLSHPDEYEDEYDQLPNFSITDVCNNLSNLYIDKYINLLEKNNHRYKEEPPLTEYINQVSLNYIGVGFYEIERLINRRDNVFTKKIFLSINEFIKYLINIQDSISLIEDNDLAIFFKLYFNIIDSIIKLNQISNNYENNIHTQQPNNNGITLQDLFCVNHNNKNNAAFVNKSTFRKIANCILKDHKRYIESKKEDLSAQIAENEMCLSRFKNILIEFKKVNLEEKIHSNSTSPSITAFEQNSNNLQKGADILSDSKLTKTSSIYHPINEREPENIKLNKDKSDNTNNSKKNISKKISSTEIYNIIEEIIKYADPETSNSHNKENSTFYLNYLIKLLDILKSNHIDNRKKEIMSLLTIISIAKSSEIENKFAVIQFAKIMLIKEGSRCLFIEILINYALELINYTKKDTTELMYDYSKKFSDFIQFFDTLIKTNNDSQDNQKKTNADNHKIMTYLQKSNYKLNLESAVKSPEINNLSLTIVKDFKSMDINELFNVIQKYIDPHIISSLNDLRMKHERQNLISVNLFPEDCLLILKNYTGLNERIITTLLKNCYNNYEESSGNEDESKKEEEAKGEEYLHISILAIKEAYNSQENVFPVNLALQYTREATITNYSYNNSHNKINHINFLKLFINNTKIFLEFLYKITELMTDNNFQLHNLIYFVQIFQSSNTKLIIELLDILKNNNELKEISMQMSGELTLSEEHMILIKNVNLDNFKDYVDKHFYNYKELLNFLSYEDLEKPNIENENYKMDHLASDFSRTINDIIDKFFTLKKTLAKNEIHEFSKEHILSVRKFLYSNNHKTIEIMLETYKIVVQEFYDFIIKSEDNTTMDSHMLLIKFINIYILKNLIFNYLFSFYHSNANIHETTRANEINRNADIIEIDFMLKNFDHREGLDHSNIKKENNYSQNIIAIKTPLPNYKTELSANTRMQKFLERMLMYIYTDFNSIGDGLNSLKLTESADSDFSKIAKKIMNSEYDRLILKLFNEKNINTDPISNICPQGTLL